MDALLQSATTIMNRIIPRHVALGLSVVLFTFMFLPTLIVLLAVVLFFVLVYPRLRKAEL